MTLKRSLDYAILKPLREIELKLADGDDVRMARHVICVSDATLHYWRGQIDGMSRAQI